jgi:hypothetical protein
VYLTATLTKDGHIIHKDTKKKSFPAAGRMQDAGHNMSVCLINCVCVCVCVTGQYDPGCVFSPTRKSIGGSVPSSPRAKFGEEM